MFSNYMTSKTTNLNRVALEHFSNLLRAFLSKHQCEMPKFEVFSCGERQHTKVKVSLVPRRSRPLTGERTVRALGRFAWRPLQTIR